MVADCPEDEEYIYGIMRILIATGIYPPDVGGPATYAKFIFDEFSKLGHGVNVLVYTRVAKGFPKGISHFVYFWKVLKLARKSDVILTTDTISAGLSVHFASWISRKPYVLKIGGDYVWEQGVQRWGVKELLDGFLDKKYGFKIELMRKLQAHVAKRAAKVIAPSKYLASICEKWGVPKENVSVIYNTILPPQQSVPEKKDEIILFSAGREVPWKGFQMLREIMPAIQKKFPKARLIAGAFPKEEMNLWYQKAALYLHNTAYEGFSHQILEAMSAGLPIITTLAGGNKEIVENRKNALVAGYNDKEAWIRAISELLQNPELQNTLSMNAKNTAQKFMNKDMVGETLEVLEKAYAK